MAVSETHTIDPGSDALNEHTVSPSLGLRQPATSVIAECLRVQATVPSNTAVQRFFGVSPLGREAEPWYVGALGELEVARRLAGLGPEWYVLHSVPVGSGASDLDHVVIGPGGVFTINTKHHRGQNVWVGAKRILVNGQRTDHLRNAAYEGKRTSKLLSVSARMLVDVTPIIAIVGARRMTVRERPYTVAVLRDFELVGWLQRHPVTLTAEQVQQLASLAAQPATWKRMPETEAVDHDAFDRLRRDIERARRRRVLWVTLGIAALPFAAMAIYSATFWP
ncbi:nuclease-related domain-containing protein [Agromyces sp. H66]|uniref:nuclease-related domain-containing protein n=1 Tax=Agromyces sp. H66 TaxID=2529859 RepID=UPI00145AC1FC|nr:nuclease-related domain-containing protein [Agromyces sp. H66]